MGFLIKSLLGLAVAGVIGGLVVNNVPSLKEKVIETVNPAAKERRILGEMTASLDEINKNFEEMGGQQDPGLKEKITNSQNLLKKSKELLQSVSEINNDKGVIGSQLGKIIDAFSEKIPYPAEDLTPSGSQDIKCRQ